MYLERYTALLGQGGTIQVHTLVLPDGEEHKSLEIMGTILDKALQVGLDRKATFVALGGGVIGDMVGFASAIYLRGINFIQVRDLQIVHVHYITTEVTFVTDCTYTHTHTFYSLLFMVHRYPPQSWPWSIALSVVKPASITH